MNVIKLAPASLYLDEAGHVEYGPENHTAYLVVGRSGDKVMVIEGEGVEKAAAIEHLVRKIKLLRESFDINLHGAFWRFYEEEQGRKRDAMRDMLKGLGLPVPEPTPRKKDDDGGLS